MKLNDKQLRFVEHYLINGNATESYLVAYPKVKYSTAMVNGSRLLDNENVQQIIKEKNDETAERNNITKDNIIKVLASILYNTNSKDSDRIKAGEVLNKMNGFNEPDKVINNISTNVNLRDMFEFDED